MRTSVAAPGTGEAAGLCRGGLGMRCEPADDWSDAADYDSGTPLDAGANSARGQPSRQGLMASTPEWAKSRTFRVTSLHSLARAVAAMIESKAAIGLP